jgi:hypothetical protein
MSHVYQARKDRAEAYFTGPRELRTTCGHLTAGAQARLCAEHVEAGLLCEDCFAGHNMDDGCDANYQRGACGNKSTLEEFAHFLDENTSAGDGWIGTACTKIKPLCMSCGDRATTAKVVVEMRAEALGRFVKGWLSEGASMHEVTSDWGWCPGAPRWTSAPSLSCFSTWRPSTPPKTRCALPATRCREPSRWSRPKAARTCSGPFASQRWCCCASDAQRLIAGTTKSQKPGTGRGRAGSRGS